MLMLKLQPARPALRRTILIAGFGALALISGPRSAISAAETVTLDRAAREYKLPDQIPWSKAGQSGTQSANLVGNPSQPGLYVQLLRRPPNNWSPPHKHNHTRYITVLEGTMWVGTGTDFDKNKTVPLKPGSFLIDYAGQMHYDGSKDDGLTIQIMGINPPKGDAEGK